MIYSLRFRLLLTLILVVTVAVGTVALFASRVTTSELQRYVDLDMERNRRIINTLIAYSRQHGDGVASQALVQELSHVTEERIILTDGSGQVLVDSEQQLVGQTLSCESPLPAVVVTLGPPHCVALPPSDMIAYPSAPAPALRFESAVAPAGGDILFIGTSESDMLAFGGEPPAGAKMVGSEVFEQSIAFQVPAITIRRTQGLELDPIEAGFVSAVNRSLVWSALATGGVALLLTLALSRRILGPIEALTGAARAMEKGDLSRRVPARSQDEIGQLAHAFNAMADSLARLEKLRRNLIGDVAHELRTPLTNIRGYLEALRDGVARPEPELLGSLHDEALLLNRLVDDLQDLALAEAGQIRLAPGPIAPVEAVAQAISVLQPALASRELTVSVDLPTDLPAVRADPARFGQVLRNLLNNAITHTPPGGSISIKAEYIADCRLQIADYPEPQSAIYNLQSAILVSVRDTGPGIAPEHLEDIFERFYRADRSRSRATGGAGLGLAIVRQLVEAHGGRVWAESAPGAGAVFRFTLPVAD